MMMDYAFLGRIVAKSLPFIALMDEFRWYADTLFGPPNWRLQPIRHSQDAYRRQYARANDIYNQFAHTWSGLARNTWRDVLGMLWHIAAEPYDAAALWLLAQEPASFWLVFWEQLATAESAAHQQQQEALHTLFTQTIRPSGFIDGEQMQRTMREMLAHVINQRRYDDPWFTRGAARSIIDSMQWSVDVGRPFQWGFEPLNEAHAGGPWPPPPAPILTVSARQRPQYARAA
jgi:hypothetical protein